MTTGGYSHDTIRTFIARGLADRERRKCRQYHGVSGQTRALARQRRGHLGSRLASSAPNRLGAAPSAAKALGVFAPARRQRAGDFPCGVGVQVGPVAGVIGGVSLLTMNGQSLDTVSSASRRIWSATVAGRGRVRRGNLRQRLVDGGQRGVDHFGVELDQVGDLIAIETCQSLPEPQELGGNSTGEPTNPSVIASLKGAHLNAGGGDARSTRASQTGPSYHQCPNNSGVEGGDHVGGPADRSDSEINRLRTNSTKSATWASTAWSARSGS